MSECSLILDLSGGTPLVTGARHRDGYFRADPGDPAAVLRAVFAASDMVGSFEKPIYVDYNAETCAHSRSTKVGCTKCLDACPAGAIVSLGDPGVAIDAGICGGCGACAARCPTGSISYRYPRREDMIARVQAMLGTYLAAGGAADPVLLVHDGEAGLAVIEALARYGRGLPARVLPVETHKPTQIGHVEMAAMFAAGAARIVFLLAPEDRDEIAPLEAECALTGAVLGGLGLAGSGRTALVVSGDPDVLDAELRGEARPAALKPAPFAALGSKRDIARTAFAALARQVPGAPALIALPEGAPYGRIDIDVAACTLCMACTSACPAAAVIDTPGEPRLRFVESACVQCGLCVSTCPENALALHPRLNLAPAAMAPETLKEEAPFDCVSCGKPFATRSTIARIKEQLAGKHAMFATPEKARMIEMCDTCRIEHQANSAEDPFAMGTRPRMRTTDDDLARPRGGHARPGRLHHRGRMKRGQLAGFWARQRSSARVLKEMDCGSVIRPSASIRSTSPMRRSRQAARAGLSVLGSAGAVTIGRPGRSGEKRPAMSSDQVDQISQPMVMATARPMSRASGVSRKPRS